MFLAVSLAHLRYPYDIDWMEGGQLVQSYEILAGRFPYRAPSADYIAFPYQPLYAAIVAGLGWFFGLSLPLARSVSLVSTLACAALVARAVWRETGARAYGLLAGCTVLALYPVVGFCFDCARVDSLFMALLVGALYAARYIERPWPACVASAALFVLAYKTKQLALPFFPLFLPVLAAKSRRAAATFPVLVLLPLAADFVLSQRASGGWFSFYVNQVPRAQPYQIGKVAQFPRVLATQIPVLAALSVLAAVRLVRRVGWTSKLDDTWTLATAVGAAVTLAAWARPGGWANNLMTTYVFAVIPAFVELHRVATHASETGRALVLSALALQLLRLGYNPAKLIPREADFEAGARFVEALRAIEGPVLVPQRPWLAVLAGKAPSYHANAFWEWRYLAHTNRVPEDLRRRLEEGFYRVVALDADPHTVAESEWVVPEQAVRNYACDRTLALPGRGLAPFAGYIVPGPSVLCRYAPQGQ
jgi:hypothetical protein